MLRSATREPDRRVAETDWGAGNRDPFFKTAVEELKPSWAEVEAARMAEGLTVKQAMKLLGLSRSSYYRQVRGMKDYRVRGRQRASSKHKEALREVAIKRVEAGHRRFERTPWRGASYHRRQRAVAG
jgi:predicted transcriptional regulator